MAEPPLWFGVGLDHGRPRAGDPARLLARAEQADRDGLDLVSVSDHP
jgi:hypothetical protein